MTAVDPRDIERILSNQDRILSNQAETMRGIRDLNLDKRLGREWYCASDCCELKGVSKAFFSLNKWSRPLGGEGWKVISRRHRWHRYAVREWLEQDDLTLLDLYGTDTDRERWKAHVA